MLDHLGIGVRDLAASRAFYEAALAPLGFGVVMERDDRVAFGPTARPIFWLVDREPTSAHPHRVPGRGPGARRRVPCRRARRRRARQRPPRPAPRLPPALLRRVHPRPGRQQRRSRLPHARMITRGFHRRRDTTPGDRLPPGQYLERGFPVLSAGPTPDTPLDEWTFRIAGAVDEERDVDVGGVPGAGVRDADRRHPLRHHVVEVRHDVGGRIGRHAARGRRAARRLRHRVLRRRLHDQPPARGPHGRPRLGRLRLRRRRPRARARRPRPPARPAPVLLEEREVGARAVLHGRGRARASGRRSATTTAETPGLSSAIRATDWRVATVAAIAPETPRAATLTLDVPGWDGHRAGQHVDVRLTADDGYRAQRSYSIASAPEDGTPMITVEELFDGEVSPWFVQVAREGDQFEVRGPFGGWFVWDASDSEPIMLIAGGSGPGAADVDAAPPPQRGQRGPGEGAGERARGRRRPVRARARDDRRRGRH